MPAGRHRGDTATVPRDAGSVHLHVTWGSDRGSYRPCVEGTLLFADRSRIEQVRHNLDDIRWQPALDRLSQDTERSAARSPWTVAAKSVLAPSGDPRDYVTLSEYCWPDPAQPDGLPWILRDGHINPDATAASNNANDLRAAANGVFELALWHRLTGSRTHGEQAAHVLHHWFLDPETGMRPNLQFASMIPGRAEAPGWGLIRTHPFLRVLDAELLLREAGLWPESLHDDLRQWFDEYLVWMLASSAWPEEIGRGNNHATWCLALGTGLALAVDRPRLAESFAERAGHEIVAQIDSSGDQPAELARSRSYFYCSFNLEGLSVLADVAEQAGADVWHHSTVSGQRLRAAARRLAPALRDPDSWPVPFHIDWDRTVGAAAMHRIVARCPEAADIADELGMIPVAAHPRTREWLLWDTGVSPAGSLTVSSVPARR